MKTVVCQSTVFIWIELQHVHTQDRDSYILLFVCRRCERRKGCNSNLFHQQRSFISLNCQAAHIFHAAQPELQYTQYADSQKGDKLTSDLVRCWATTSHQLQCPSWQILHVSVTLLQPYSDEHHSSRRYSLSSCCDDGGGEPCLTRHFQIPPKVFS